MPTVVGLDLGKHTLRGVEIDRNKKGTTLLHTGVYENFKIDLEDSSKTSDKDFSDTIKNFFKESGFSTSKVVISLDERDVFMRVVSFPAINDKELKSSIQFEAEQYIPLPLNEINLSYQKLIFPSEQKGKIDVQLVAAKKSVIEKYIRIVKGAHLTPIGVEPETLAIARAFSDNASSAILILHIGYEKSMVIISYKNSVLFTRAIPIGGDSMTRAISQGLSLDYIQAEEYKKAYGLNQDQAEGKIFSVLQPIFNNIIGEIARAQVFFTTHNQNVNINKVILSGGTALMPGILLYMASNLNMEVELANPFKGIIFSKDLEAKKDIYIEQGPLFTSPIGLALKEL